MGELLDLVSRAGVDRFIESLIASSTAQFTRVDLENRLKEMGAQLPSEMFDALVAGNVLQPIGRRFGITRFGQKVSLLIEAMEGGDVDDVIRRLRRVDGSQETYELVRQGMTTRFLNTFVDRPYFGALYLCSPWINLNEKEASIIRYGVLRSEKASGKKPDIFVITRPPHPKMPVGSGSGIKPLIEMGADINYLSRVHTKLYIREPDANGGFTLALVGSENLTQSGHLELGIQINGDGRLISQLVAHFYELTSYTSEKA
ncbi:MAG: hypothetical protein WD871_08395 [Xanthobacteraceae bacterium]